MENITAGFDVDDVLLPSSSHAIRWYNKHFNTHLTPSHWYKNIPTEPWAAESDRQVIERVNIILNSEDYLSEIVPMDGALDVLNDLDANGDRKIAITSRPPWMKEMTHRALELCYPGAFPEGTVHFIDYSTASINNNRIQKVEIALSEGVTHYTDDMEDHLRPMGAVGIKPLLFGKDYDWNQNITTPELQRIEDWPALGEFFAHERSR